MQQNVLSVSNTAKGKTKRKKKSDNFQNYPSFRSKVQTLAYARQKAPEKEGSNPQENEKAVDIIENLKSVYMSLYNPRQKKRKRKVKPVFVEHREGSLEEDLKGDLGNTLSELDHLLTDKRISPEMRAHIENYVSKLRSGAGTDGSDPDIMWDPEVIGDTLQEAGIPESSTIDEYLDALSEELRDMEASPDLLLNTSVFDEVKHSNDLQKVTSATMSKVFGVNVNKETFDRLKLNRLEFKIKRFQEELLSFVDVCITTGMVSCVKEKWLTCAVSLEW